MANRQRAQARRKAQAAAARRGEAQSTSGGESAGFAINIWVAVVVILAVIAGVVLWATSGDESKTTETTRIATTIGGNELPDSQPVAVTGDALPRFDPDETKNIAPVGELADAAVGLAAPKLSGLDFEGDPVVVEPGVGGPYMLVFLAHWCPHCNAEIPRLLAWKASGAVPTDLNVIGVATAVYSNRPNYPPAEWFSDSGWSWPVLVDELSSSGDKAAGAYGLRGFPFIVIIGADGLVKARIAGEIEADDLQVIVDDVLAS